MLCGVLLDNKIINMNNLINKFLLAGDKFMPEMHLRQPRFDCMFLSCQVRVPVAVT